MCDTFVSLPDTTADGSVILGKNSDREPNEAHELRMLPATDPGEGRVRATYIEIDQVPHTHAVILSKPYWIWGAEMGVNEHGVAIGNEAVFTKAKREDKPGLLGMDLLRLALERATTAEEAVEVITTLLVAHGQHGQAGHTHKLLYDNSFIVADRAQAWIVETVGRDWAAQRVQSTASISNGLTLGRAQMASPGLTGLDVKERSDFVYTRFSDSKARQCRTSDALVANRGNLDVSAAMRMLRDHGDVGPDWTPAKGVSGQTVCAHAGFGPIRVAQSTGSMVSHVSADDITVWLTGTSAPCTSVFKPVWFDGGLPDQKQPGKRFDPQTMWWRHELLHRATLRNYPEREAAYAKLRDDLEAEFLDAVPDDRRAFTKRCFESADTAERQWLDAVRDLPAARIPALYRRAWQKWDRQAGLA
jgi:dipeptidase